MLTTLEELLYEDGYLAAVIGNIVPECTVLIRLELMHDAVYHTGGEDMLFFVDGAVLQQKVS